MGEIFKLPINNSSRIGFQKVRRKRRIDPEDHGQLNLFKQDGAKTVNFSDSLFEQGLQLDENDDITGAAELYLKAIEEEDHVADAYCNMGIVQSKLGNPERAFDCFKLALQKDSAPRRRELPACKDAL